MIKCAKVCVGLVVGLVVLTVELSPTRRPCALVRRPRYSAQMSSFFGLSNNGYGADLMFGLAAVLLALPVAGLLAASVLEGLMKQRTSSVLAPAPLSLRRSPLDQIRGTFGEKNSAAIPGKGW